MQLQPPKPSAAGWAEEQHISPGCMARRSSSFSSSVLCILLKKPSSSSLTERLGVKCRPLHYVLYQNWANWWRKGRPEWRQGSCGLSNCLIRTHQSFSAGALWHKQKAQCEAVVPFPPCLQSLALPSLLPLLWKMPSANPVPKT